MYFGTETSGLNREDGQVVFNAEIYCIWKEGGGSFKYGPINKLTLASCIRTDTTR